MLDNLKENVLKANLELPLKGLVQYTWGNVSEIDREHGIVAIKPSGVSYEQLSVDDIVLIDFDGKIIEGNLNPSSDTATHLVLYKSFPDIGGICHTHSRWATIWSQLGMGIKPYGTTHADYFYGTIPCTADLLTENIKKNYEENTGLLIAEIFNNINPNQIPAVLVKNHGPFTWGKDAKGSVHNAVVLEEIAQMAWHVEVRNPSIEKMSQDLLDKHYLRKHGKNSYYGQIVN